MGYANVMCGEVAPPGLNTRLIAACLGRAKRPPQALLGRRSAAHHSAAAHYSAAALRLITWIAIQFTFSSLMSVHVSSTSLASVADDEC